MNTAASHKTSPPSDSALRVLLWSPVGSGAHYHGPGLSAYRLYRSAAPGRFDVTLAHGWPDHATLDLFGEQHFLADMRGGTLAQWRFIRAGCRWLDEHCHRFDVMHGLQGFHITVKPACHAKARGLPAVIKLATHKADLASKPGLKGLLKLPEKRRKMVSRLDAVIAISHAIVEELRGYGIADDKIVRIPNGVDTSRFGPADPSAKSDLRRQLDLPDRPMVLFVGSIFPRKRPHLIVEAFSRIAADGQLVLVGPVQDEAYHRRILATIAEHGLTERVTVRDYTPSIEDYYRAADVYCLPSRAEGMPNSVLEAMASGLPAVCTAISGTTDLIDDGRCGRLIEPAVEPLAEALGDYLADPPLAARHGEQARRRIDEQYSTQAVLDEHERLFRRIMAGQPAAG